MSPAISQEKLFFNQLTSKDRVVNRFVIRAGIIEKYSVQYEALIGGRWKAITRFDSVHGGPHRHIYRGSGKDLRVATPYFNFNEAFTSAQEFVKKNFASMKENYLLSSRGGV